MTDKKTAKGIKCKRCGMSRTQDEYYAARRVTDEAPDGYLQVCKNCLGNLYKDEDPGTFMHILHALDIPWMPSRYKEILSKEKARNSIATLGKYITGTKLVQYSRYGFEDSNSWQLDNMDADDLDFIENYDYKTPVHMPVLTVAKPTSNFTMDDVEREGRPQNPTPEMEATNFVTLLTREERDYLQFKWGPEFLDEDLLSLEKKYQEISKDFNIETAMDRDYLMKICMVSHMQDQSMRANDLKDAKAASEMYSKLTKDANLQPTQNAETQGHMNSMSELVNIVEKEGPIPRYIPSEDDLDLADITIKDLKSFTRDLFNNDESIQSRYNKMREDLEEVGIEEYEERVVSGNEEIDLEANVKKENRKARILDDILYEGLDGLSDSDREKAEEESEDD